MTKVSEISIVVPVYKVEKYLHRCVDSLLNQSFTAFDLILVDDGSPDQCGQICDQYAKQDKRIQVIHQRNGGLSAARNSGIDWSLSNSDSKWITFVDSDDWVHPQYLSLLYESASVCKADVSVCAYKELHDSLDQVYEKMEDRSGTEWKPEDFFVENHVNATVAWGKLYKKEYFKTLRYPVGKIHEDEFITYQILFGIQKIAFINIPLYYYYINDSGIMKTESKYRRSDVLEALAQQTEYFEKYHFDRAKKISVRAYAGALCSWINTLADQQSRENSKLYQELIKKLKQVLKRYRRLFPFEECRWAYVVVYPWRTKCYGFVKWVLSKVKRVWQLSA